MNLRNLPFLRMFMPKRKKGFGAMWASLFGVGISAAVFGLTRGKRSNFALPLKNTLNNFTPSMNIGRTDISRMDNAALAEFSEELMESAMNNKQ
ncbi:hypothetical protein HPT25_23840 [Bacillus sp. BRMEA1]|uniref:hypothetical protein n=1 Tax=Neobacillus endophyticus TaxID=2738405 RepID=UPI001564414A|nr:hypothetical protein [Neobacillus endophyticus]NRD80357.1 hypothetical protein [Neobacillus endophyticus]